MDGAAEVIGWAAIFTAALMTLGLALDYWGRHTRD